MRVSSLGKVIKLFKRGGTDDLLRNMGNNPALVLEHVKNMNINMNMNMNMEKTHILLELK